MVFWGVSCFHLYTDSRSSPFSSSPMPQITSRWPAGGKQWHRGWCGFGGFLSLMAFNLSWLIIIKGQMVLNRSFVRNSLWWEWSLALATGAKRHLLQAKYIGPSYSVIHVQGFLHSGWVLHGSIGVSRRLCAHLQRIGLWNSVGWEESYW